MSPQCVDLTVVCNACYWDGFVAGIGAACTVMLFAVLAATYWLKE